MGYAGPMTNTTAALLVTDCPAHGVTACADLNSQSVYRDAAHACAHEMEFDPKGHMLDHIVDGTDCWACCPEMRIADQGEEG